MAANWPEKLSISNRRMQNIFPPFCRRPPEQKSSSLVKQVSHSVRGNITNSHTFRGTAKPRRCKERLGTTSTNAFGERYRSGTVSIVLNEPSRFWEATPSFIDGGGTHLGPWLRQSSLFKSSQRCSSEPSLKMRIRSAP